MNRLTIALVATGLLCLANSAEASVLLYGWNGSDEGWTVTVDSQTNGGSIIGTSPARGITEGTGALEAQGNVNDEGKSSFRLISPVETGAVLQQLAGRTQLVVDAVIVSEDYGGFRNFNFSLTILGKDADGNNFSTKATVLEHVGGFDQSRINSNQGTYTYDYSTIAGGSLTAGTAQSVQFRFDFSLAGGLNLDDDPAANDVAIDNFRVVPEPAALSVLGLGGLVLTGRRRRSA